MKTFRLGLILWLCLFSNIDNLAAQIRYPLYHSLLDQLTLPSDGQSMRSSSTDPNIDGNGDSRLIQPGETLVLADLEGPGIIHHLWNTSASLNPYSARALVIRIYWDHSEKPSVEVPLGDFFGVGQGANVDYQSLPMNISSHGRSRNCFWSMPFKKHAKITISNDLAGFGPTYFYYYVDWEKVKALPEEVLYFHARYHQQSKAKPGDHLVLNTTGRGSYVGTVYSVLQTVNGWFGEGDDRFFIDGEKIPSIQGTGTEDYFGDAWGFREFSGSFNGVPLYEGPLAGDRVSAYRWHIMDPIHFSKSLKFSIEHKGSDVDDNGKERSRSDERADWVSSVAFWYQTPITFSETGLPPAIERIPPYRILLASNLKFKATPDKTSREKTGIDLIPEKPDGEIEFEFEVETEGKYKISAVLVDNLFGSKYQPSIDHQPAGPVLDLISKGGDWKGFNLGTFNLGKGKHTFALQGRGASSDSRPEVPSKFAIGISSLSLLRIDSL
jgi:Protein of unknown function (DUF2961)